MKQTGFISSPVSNQQDELFGTRTMAKFYPRPSKEKLAKKKNLFVKVPDN